MKPTAIVSEKTKFIKVLKKYGFTPLANCSGCYEHKKNGWFAEIIKHSCWTSLWMVGKGLKDSGAFPGGWHYSSPEELEEELKY